MTPPAPFAGPKPELESGTTFTPRFETPTA